jgi:hypothetical protein
MMVFSCICGQPLFFENSQCLNCWRRVGWCPACQLLTALEPGSQPGRFVCARVACGAQLRLCHNYAEHGVCNRCVLADQAPPGGTADQPMCDMCRFNATIPDLSIAGNAEKWCRLEAAKRRVLRQFRLLQLPPFGFSPVAPPLTFDFKADAVPTQQGWHPMGTEQVYTGYQEGKVTINIREADSVERERLRVGFGESYRTLIGHFRHELSHYLWDARIAGSQHEPRFVEIFGDPRQPSYGEALQRYHWNGPPADWPQRFISAYATVHPFEDWAESTAALFHGHCILETAGQYGYDQIHLVTSDTPSMLDRFIEIGVFLNEVNREMGLLDVLPGVFSPPVREKMRFAWDVLTGRS